jgi:lipid-A-disaccharide synthase
MFNVQSRNIIALLAGSRRQEIKDNLPAMLKAVEPFQDRYQIVLAGAPGIEPDYYRPFIEGRQVEVVFNQTFALLSQAYAALVTSGTATLETALFDVPQVVCYKLPLPPIADFVRHRLLKVSYVSLVNLIADREVVTELLGQTFTVEHIRRELEKILQQPGREQMLQGYADVRRRLGDSIAPDEAAKMIFTYLNKKSKS